MIRLTERERQIAMLVGEGLTNKAICGHLYITPKTVEAHLAHISEKVGFVPMSGYMSRVLIARWAWEEERREQRSPERNT